MRRLQTAASRGRLVLLIMFAGVFPALVSAATAESGFVDRVYRDAAGTHKYVVFVPRNYTAKKSLPVILFLHGAGERGTDGRKQLSAGLGPVVKARRKTFPYLVVFPQVENPKGRILTAWSPKSPDGARALKILDSVEKEFHVDTHREILTGWSMGGYGAWSMAAATPKRWWAVVPLSGGGDVASAKALKHVPLWAFHGADDRVVPPRESRRMVDAVKAAGGHPRYSVLPGVGHNIWNQVYNSEALYAWLRNPRAAATSPTTALRVRPGQRPLAAASDEEPFVPAVEIPRAFYVHLGNRALSDAAYSIPEVVPKDILTGRLKDINDSTVAQGRYFDVQFSEIRYSAQVKRAFLKAYAKDLLNIQFGLRNVRLKIGTTYVTGRHRSAVAGEIDVVIGHRKPVWLSLAVTPYIQKRTIRLKLVAVNFHIADDNWYVTAPAGVSTQGLGMTADVVSDGLVNGIYSRKARIEREVRALVPGVIAQIEKKLDVSPAANTVNSFWPLPVYQPRLRIWPESVLTDAKGVSVMFGLTAAAIDPHGKPKPLRHVAPEGPTLGDVSRGKELQVGVRANVLKPLTELLIDADVARIHVRDIPEKSFDGFADRKTLIQAIPDLKRYGEKVEIWSELVLAQPIEVHNAGAAGKSGGAAHGGFRFASRQVLISMAIRTDPHRKTWTPYAEFEFHVSQSATARVIRPSYTDRAVELDWTGDPSVVASARFAPGYRPKDGTLNRSKIREMFVTAWQAWTKSGPVARSRVPDVDFGYSKLRLSAASWNSPSLALRFAAPGVKISNLSKVPLVYQTKAPDSRWSDPITLPPGQDHEFDIAYPLLYRRRVDGRYRMFTLPAGSHSEYRAPRRGGPLQLFKSRA